MAEASAVETRQERRRRQSRERMRRLREENHEKMREYQRQYARDNRDKINQWAAECRERNREKIRERQREFRRQHPEYFREKNREAYSRNREKILKQKQEYTSDERVKEQRRKYYLKHKYGLTLQRFNEMWEAQDGKCALCHSDMVVGSNIPNACHVDHCHETGAVRGLLCNCCNLTLGYLESGWDAISFASNASEYLAKAKLSGGDHGRN